MVTDDNDGIWDGHTGQLGAVIERVVAESGHVVCHALMGDSLRDNHITFVGVVVCVPVGYLDSVVASDVIVNAVLNKNFSHLLDVQEVVPVFRSLIGRLATLGYYERRIIVVFERVRINSRRCSGKARHVLQVATIECIIVDSSYGFTNNKFGQTRSEKCLLIDGSDGIRDCNAHQTATVSKRIRVNISDRISNNYIL